MSRLLDKSARGRARHPGLLFKLLATQMASGERQAGGRSGGHHLLSSLRHGHGIRCAGAGPKRFHELTFEIAPRR